MHCKSLWIKASAKCINVNVNVIAQRGEHLTVHEVDCLREETVVPGCPGICGSEAPARWQKFKKGMTWM